MRDCLYSFVHFSRNLKASTIHTACGSHEDTTVLTPFSCFHHSLSFEHKLINVTQLVKLELLVLISLVVITFVFASLLLCS